MKNDGFSVNKTINICYISNKDVRIIENYVKNNHYIFVIIKWLQKFTLFQRSTNY